MTPRSDMLVGTVSLGSLLVSLFCTGCADGDAIAGSADTKSAELALSTDQGCDAGRLLNPETGACAAVQDRRMNALSSSQQDSRSPPKLSEKRRERAQRGSRSAATAQSQSNLPVPGGLGAGITFQSGKLSALSSATLYTHMVVHPDGTGQLPDWLFTTSTNRTEKGVEVVGIYLSAGQGDIGVFDWSCSESYPCANGVTSPSWIWTRPFAQNPCHYAQQLDAAGVEQTATYYANSTHSANGQWHNEVTFWNYCTEGWDLVYSHEYGGTQPDCAATGCGWWGPIIENFFDLSGSTPIAELGFFDTELVHDGQTSLLPPSDTSWSSPPSNWTLCYRIPNSSWSTTNQSCAGAANALELSTQVRSDWETGYCMDVTVSNTASQAVAPWAVRLNPNQSTLANTWSANFQVQANATYVVTPVQWNATVPAHGSISFGFCANKTGSQYLPSLSLI
jgi:hypothetical protein